MKTSGKIQCLLALAALAAVPVAANAATTELLQLQVNGGTPITINDNGTGDINNAIGTITIASGTASGGVSFGGNNISTRGPTTQLNDNTISITNTGNASADVTILLSDYNFAPAGSVGSPPSLTNLLAGTYYPDSSTGSASASVTSYVDPNNAQITLSNYSSFTNTGASSVSTLPDGTFNGTSTSVNYTLGSGDFSLAQVATLVVPVGAQLNLSATTSTNVSTIPSPEPASFALLGAAALPLLLRRRKGTLA
ncbi:MAG: hypothetical protein HKL96_06555 [Phycisphaerales bacterium]|nr:hypothetical protein [Phycisphaerales bacterium]